jgi:Xaa-Pro aminopeptidase
MDFVSRQKRSREQMKNAGLDALLVTHLPNIRYLCGFTGSAGVLLLSSSRSVFFTDGRYREQARAEVVGARVMVPKDSALAASAKEVSRLGVRVLGIDADHTTVATQVQLKHLLSGGLRLKSASGIIERLRMVKDADEILTLRNAVALGSRLLGPAMKSIASGVKETSVAAEIEYAARKAGAEGMSFETIVAAGVRSALPHGVASHHAIPAKGFVVLDFGVILAGYCSDMTRTVHVGKVGSEDRDLFGAVLQAQLAAIASIAPGVEVGNVDHAARSSLRKAKLDKYFTHSTGHGVGLEIHEIPRVARGQKEALQPGMVVTVEPGVYIPGKGGVRIEDMVVVTTGGCEVLTKASKQLIEL